MTPELAAILFSSTRQVAWTGVAPLCALLIIAAWCDIRSRRIPNRLVFPGMALGLVLQWALPQGLGFISYLPGSLGILDGLEGLLIGLAAFLPLYLLRAMGAGDVKLMAMAGAFLGLQQTLAALLCVALTGGVLALSLALYGRVLTRMLANVRSMLTIGWLQLASGSAPSFALLVRPAAAMPYGVAIALGTLAYLIGRAWWFGYL